MRLDLYNYVYDTAYKKGLEDAWECAGKIAKLTKDGGYSSEELSNIFGSFTSLSDFFNKPVEEVLQKIQEYEDKQELHFGDVVIVTNKKDKTKYKGIYLSTKNDTYIFSDSKGYLSYFFKEEHDIEKTGKRINISLD